VVSSWIFDRREDWMEFDLGLGLVTFATAAAVSFAAVSDDAKISSIYTDLNGAGCQTVESNQETDSLVLNCPGVGGYHLLVANDDSRMSVSIVSPGNEVHELDYWNVITKAFSNLGSKAEWRLVQRDGKVVPIALIVRVNAYEQEDLEHPQKRSYLAVSKITDNEICVTDKIEPDANANEKARQAADISSAKNCVRP